jgi:hypothetical protein
MLLRADEVVGRQVVARHVGSTVKGSTTLVHQEILVHKPGVALSMQRVLVHVA